MVLDQLVVRQLKKALSLDWGIPSGVPHTKGRRHRPQGLLQPPRRSQRHLRVHDQRAVQPDDDGRVGEVPAIEKDAVLGLAGLSTDRPGHERFAASAEKLQIPVLFLITATLFASYLVRIFAWQSILGGNGLLNSGLRRLGIIDEPLGFLLYNRFAVTVALVHIFLPYVVLVLYAGFRPVSPALIEAAQDLGANAFTRWRRVILPLVAAPAATAFLLVFVLSAADYVTPQFVGGTDGALLGVRIQAALTGVGNWPLGAALSFLMLGAFLLCYLLVALALRLMRLDRIRFVS